MEMTILMITICRRTFIRYNACLFTRWLQWLGLDGLGEKVGDRGLTFDHAVFTKPVFCQICINKYKVT